MKNKTFLNDATTLQSFLLLTILYIYHASAPITVWYLCGFFLFLIGLIGLTFHLDILIGFLWVVDLGVGLIFLLFLAHLTIFLETPNSFSNSKLTRLSLVSLYLLFCIVSTIFTAVNETLREGAFTSFYTQSFLNYTSLIHDCESSTLNLLRESFFYTNVWGFYVVNVVALLSLLGMIIFQLSTQNAYKLQSWQSLLSYHTTHAPLFIRDQNFIKQQQTTTSTRLWRKHNISNKVN